MNFDGTLPDPADEHDYYVSQRPKDYDGPVDRLRTLGRDLFFLIVASVLTIVIGFIGENTDTILSTVPPVYAPIAGGVLTVIVTALTGLTHRYGRKQVGHK